MAKRKNIKKTFDNYVIQARTPSAKDSLNFIPRIAAVFPTEVLTGVLNLVGEKGLEEASQDIMENPQVIMMAIQESSVLLVESESESLTKLLEDFFSISTMMIIKEKEGEEAEWKDVEVSLDESWDDYFDMSDMVLLGKICIWALSLFFIKR